MKVDEKKHARKFYTYFFIQFYAYNFPNFCCIASKLESNKTGNFSEHFVYIIPKFCILIIETELYFSFSDYFPFFSSIQQINYNLQNHSIYLGNNRRAYLHTNMKNQIWVVVFVQ